MKKLTLMFLSLFLSIQIFGQVNPNYKQQFKPRLKKSTKIIIKK